MQQQGLTTTTTATTTTLQHGTPRTPPPPAVLPNAAAPGAHMLTTPQPNNTMEINTTSSSTTSSGALDDDGQQAVDQQASGQHATPIAAPTIMHAPSQNHAWAQLGTPPPTVHATTPQSQQCLGVHGGTPRSPGQQATPHGQRLEEQCGGNVQHALGKAIEVLCSRGQHLVQVCVCLFVWQSIYTHTLGVLLHP